MGGSGIKIKEIGTVMRSLGLAPAQAQIKVFMDEAAKKDGTHVGFSDFMSYVKQAKSAEADKNVDFEKEMAGMKQGVSRFYDKLSHKQIRENPPDMLKLADIKHLLSTGGEKLSEEEIEELSKDVRQNCKVEDGRVSFDDFVKLLKT